jgi:hypothetical protein
VSDDDPILSTDMPVWSVCLIIAMMLGTCVATSATEDLALAACYEAGFSPSECKP